ncbi:MAG: ABC transporter ATP-binding protein [Hyphomicrobiaceae bacterium]|nr:MAG: ABC transporter ATP-binding protein [Hyphomicrobiaceae bacterium]
MGKPEPASVEFRSVSKRYGSVTAVDAISFRIEPGTLVTLLGPSGCGKTTTLRLIAGLELSTSGEILIGDRDVTRLSAADRNVSMVFQSYALFPHMTVLQNAAYGPSATGMKRADAEALAAEKLALLGLTGLEKRLPSELSGGQQQRVAVARALVLEPQVLLFDEPLSNLDAKLRRRVRDDIRGLQQRLKLTVAYVTHDQQEALAVSDRIIVMSNARIAQSGRPRELYEEPASTFVADFIGDSNQVEGELSRANGATARVRLAGVNLDLPHRGVPAGAVKVAIRPESIIIEEAPPNADAIEARIAKSAYLGTHMEYTVDCPLGSLFIVDRNVARPLQPGRTVWLRIGEHGVTVLPEARNAEAAR